MNFIHANYKSYILFGNNTIAIVYVKYKAVALIARSEAMKIMLQLEAKTISNEELADNQKDLIDLLAKIYRFCFFFPKKAVKNIVP